MKDYIFLIFIVIFIVDIKILVAEDDFGWETIDSIKIQKLIPSEIIQYGMSESNDTIFTYSKDYQLRAFDADSGKLLYSKEIRKDGKSVRFVNGFAYYYYFEREVYNINFSIFNTYNNDSIFVANGVSFNVTYPDHGEHRNAEITIDLQNKLAFFSVIYSTSWYAPSGYSSSSLSGVCRIYKLKDKFGLDSINSFECFRSGPIKDKKNENFIFLGYRSGSSSSHGTPETSNTSSYIFSYNPVNNKVDTLFTSSEKNKDYREISRIILTEIDNQLVLSTNTSLALFNTKSKIVKDIQDFDSLRFNKNEVFPVFNKDNNNLIIGSDKLKIYYYPSANLSRSANINKIRNYIGMEFNPDKNAVYFFTDSCFGFTNIYESNQTVKADFIADKYICYQGDTIQLTNKSNNYRNQKWIISDKIELDVENPKIIIEKTGMIDVKLIVWNEFSSDTIAKVNIIKAIEKLNVDFSSDEVSGKSPFSVNFKNESDGMILDYFWDFGDGITATDKEPSHIYYKSGRYNVSLTVKDEIRSISETKEAYIGVDTNSYFTIKPIGNYIKFAQSVFFNEFVFYTDPKVFGVFEKDKLYNIYIASGTDAIFIYNYNLIKFDSLFQIIQDKQLTISGSKPDNHVLDFHNTEYITSANSDLIGFYSDNQGEIFQRFFIKNIPYSKVSNLKKSKDSILSYIELTGNSNDSYTKYNEYAVASAFKFNHKVSISSLDSIVDQCRLSNNYIILLIKNRKTREYTIEIYYNDGQKYNSYLLQSDYDYSKIESYKGFEFFILGKHKLDKFASVFFYNSGQLQWLYKSSDWSYFNFILVKDTLINLTGINIEGNPGILQIDLNGKLVKDNRISTITNNYQLDHIYPTSNNMFILTGSQVALKLKNAVVYLLDLDDKTSGKDSSSKDSSYIEPDPIINNVFPNPASDKINILGLESSDLNIWIIYDLFGNQISEGKFDNPNGGSIDIRSLSIGNYYLKIITHNGFRVLKFIKQKE